jgi:GNAT superfamily N-acetyltransferase
MSTSHRQFAPGGVAFREIEAGDHAALATFLVANDVPAVVRTFNPFPMTGETARRIALEPRRDRYYGAFLADSIVALSMLRGWDEGFDVPSFGIIVDHRFHNRGIGAALTDYTVEAARRLNCARVRLSVYASNPAAVHVYASHGFVEHERVPVTLSGVPDEKIVMVKVLS